MVIIRLGDPDEILLMLGYADELARVDGQWLFRSRRLVPLTAAASA